MIYGVVSVRTPGFQNFRNLPGLGLTVVECSHVCVVTARLTTAPNVATNDVQDTVTAAKALAGATGGGGGGDLHLNREWALTTCEPCTQQQFGIESSSILRVRPSAVWLTWFTCANESDLKRRSRSSQQ